eukprot:c6433_g1_i1.p1 GENE.c6433_g1_i1~~c6433_g1_i1.p1  ORF type:complete len:148 (-),score=28.57 c6433_g1_i1:47-490(-)
MCVCVSPIPVALPPSCWGRIVVSNFPGTLFHVREKLNPFVIELRTINGGVVPVEIIEGLKIRVRISVWNKWANVTSEVLRQDQIERPFVGTGCLVRDVRFHQISLRHGGFFMIAVEECSHRLDVMPWLSSRIIVRSAKANLHDSDND